MGAIRHRAGSGPHHKHANTLLHYEHQCRGKILFKVMHYNIALLPIKVTNYVTLLLLLWKVMLRYFLDNI